MSLLNVRNVSFHYEGSPDNVFENVSFQIDTDWKLGFISRNGRGKTTFLRLLAGELPYQGAIDASVRFDYFPFPIADMTLPALAVARAAIAPFDGWQREMDACLARGGDAALDRYGVLQDLMIQHDGYNIDELIAREAGKLLVSPEALARPFDTLSHGERTKLMIAAMFLRRGNYPLIDEPTNHLDAQGRQALEAYLSAKRSFILVSHDRALLDGVVDHVLSINRTGMEVQRGNYSSWKRNRDQQDALELRQNEQIRGEIGRLSQTMRQKSDWSDRVEATKIGTHAADRGAIGAQAARMMKKAKAIERRVQSAIDERSGLLKNVETADALKLHPLDYYKRTLVEAVDLQVDYGAGPLFAPQSFTIGQGERVALLGPNGAGKTSVLRLLLGEDVPHTGLLRRGLHMTVSYVPQDTGHLRGLARDWAQGQGIDVTLFLTILRKLDFPREAFDRAMEDYSEGMKKKVVLAGSLATAAHLYVWDEPLNYIDVLSRVQIETLLRGTPSTIVFVEHDRSFVENVATREILLGRG